VGSAGSEHSSRPVGGTQPAVRMCQNVCEKKFWKNLEIRNFCDMLLRKTRGARIYVIRVYALYV